MLAQESKENRYNKIKKESYYGYHCIADAIKKETCKKNELKLPKSIKPWWLFPEVFNISFANSFFIYRYAHHNKRRQFLSNLLPNAVIIIINIESRTKEMKDDGRWKRSMINYYYYIFVTTISFNYARHLSYKEVPKQT